MSVDESEGDEHDIYARELDEREDLIEACPFEIYVSSINPRWGYPYKLMPYTEARPGVRDSSRMCFIDSGYSQIGSMSDILTAAQDIGATGIIPPDMTPAIEGYEDLDAKTHAYEVKDHYWEFVRSDFEGDIYLPLHPPFDEFTYELGHYDPGYVLGLKDDPAFDYPKTDEELEMYLAGRAHYSETYDLTKAADGVAVGGLRGLSVDERIEGIREVYHGVGRDTKIHALAPGTELEMIRFLRKNPQMVDSIDLSTPETAPANGKIPDATWHQHKHLFPPGTNSTTVRGMASTMIAIQLNFMLGPFFSSEALEMMIDER